MFKVIVTTLSLLSTACVFAESELTVSKIANDSETRKAFHNMTKGHTLPEWIMKSATGSPAISVKLGNKTYQVVSGCKPHSCADEKIAIMYSTQDKSMSGVFSRTNGNHQSLSWLDPQDDISIDAKTVLFASINGALENHPDGFNFN